MFVNFVEHKCESADIFKMSGDNVSSLS